MAEKLGTRYGAAVTRNMNALYSMCVRVLRSYGLLQRGASFIVASSGGMDSTVLCHIMSQLARRWKLRLRFVYVNHGLRPEAETENDFVKDLAEKCGADFSSVVIDVRGELQNTQSSLQDVARRLRYEALENIRRGTGADAIVTAHHADDQSETLLAHFLRGSGVTGLMGIRQRWGNVIRPLLEAEQVVLLSYARKYELKWMEDVSNLSDDYSRNALRHHVIPVIQKRINPGLNSTLWNTSRLYSALETYLEAQTKFLREHTVSEDVYGDFFLALAKLKGYLEFERLLLFRFLLSELQSSEPGFDVVLAVENLLRADPGRYIDVGRNIRIYREKQAMVFSRITELPGITEIVVGEKAKYGGFLFNSRINTELPAFTADRKNEVIDLDSVGRHWQLRPWKDEDVFVPFGSPEKKRVSDFLASAGFTLRQRRKIPVLSGKNGIIWVCGVRLDNHAALKDSSKHSATIEFYSPRQQ